MATTDGLSSPGSSSYESNTLSVGDGTWDSDRNSFLLPNLQGLNFATMQYIGMGNRFRDLPEYHSLILGHGIVAAITFLGVVPAAIFIARFYHSSGRTAYKLHVYLQILTVFLATVVLVLGWFAVGPERSLSNPHHGIGVAIYVAILAQFLYGWWMSRRERKRKTPHPTIPLKVHIHRIFGRAVAILAFVQIALGLTLYGSPKALFILYALFGALVIFAYLALEYRNKPRFGAGGPLPGPHSDYPSDYYSDYTGSYLTGSRTDMTRSRRRPEEDKSSGWGKKLLAGAGAFGAYKWWKGRQDHKEIEEKESEYDSRNDRRDDRRPRPPGPSAYSDTTSVGPSGQYGRPGTPGRRQPSRPPPPTQYNAHRTPQRSRHNDTEMSPQSWEDDLDNEEYNDKPQGNTWRDRIVGGVAGIAAFQGVKSLFGSKKKRQDGYVDSDVSYRPPPHGGHQSTVSQTDVSRVEAGQAPFSPEDQRGNRRVHMADTQPMTPTRPPTRTRPSEDSLSYSEATSFAPPRRQMTAEGPNLKDSIATMGAIAGLRDWNQRRKNRKEDERLERIRKQELQHEESFNRRNSDRYPRPQDASGRRQSLSDTVMTGPTGPDPTIGSSRQSMRPADTSHPPLPAAAGLLPYGSAAPGQYNENQQQQTQPQQPPYHDPYQQPYPPPPPQHQQQVMFDLPPPPPGPPPNAARPLDYQPPPPGSLQMPQGVVNPDPSRLVGGQSQNQPSTAAPNNFPAGGAAAGYAAGNHQRTQSESPSRGSGRPDSRSRYGAAHNRRDSTASASISQANTSSGVVPQASPPVSVKVNMHPDGRHVTLRRLNEDEAAVERAARKRGEKKTRRNSSLSSGVDNDDGGRYRRHGGGGQVRNSSRQPITNVPPPPAMSNSALRRDSELNLPPVPPGHSSQVLSQATGPAGSGAVNSPGTAAGGTDLGTGTDLSNFDNNRRRRRAERARRMEAARGGGKGVEFS